MLVTSGLVLLALPACSSAWTATITDSRLTLVDGSGVGDAIVLEDDGPSLRVVSEASAGLEGVVPAGCVASGGDLVCAASAVTTVEVHGGGGDDRIENASSVGQLVAFGDGGDDALVGGAGGDVLDGGVGDDRLTGGSGADRLAGGAGLDDVAGGAGEDALDGGEGFDRLNGGSGDDALAGGADGDTLYGGAANDLLDGGGGDDVLDGGDGSDVLNGSEGDDLLQAAVGADTLHGGAGEDRLLATSADPVTLAGGDGNDALQGGEGEDQLDGGAGDDVLDGGDGADAMAGGGGSDTVDYRQRVATVAVTVGGGADDGAASERDDVHGDVEQVLGGAGDDVLAAGAAPAQLRGGLGGDTLRGGQAADVLDGGDGEDKLQARSISADRDVVRCGGGLDLYDADRSDGIASDCESGHVDGAPVTSVPQLRDGPRALIVAPLLRVVRVDRANRVAFGVTCRAQTVGRCEASLDLHATAGRHSRLGSVHFRVAPGKTRRVRFPLRARAVRALRRADRRGFTGRMDLTLTDARGRTAVQRIALRVQFQPPRRAKPSEPSRVRV